MKKAIFIVCLFVLGATTQAQIISSSSKKVTTTKTKRVTSSNKFIRVGFASMSVSGDDVNAYLKSETYNGEVKNKLGYNFTFGFRNPINIDINMFNPYWSMEFGLGSRGLKFEDKAEDEYFSYSQDVSVIAYNLQISPITIGTDFILTNEIRLDVHFGLYLSLDFAGKAKAETKEEDKYYDDSWKDDDDFSFSEGKDWLKDSDHKYIPYDIGTNLGFGIWYNNFNFDITLQNGFVDIIKSQDRHGDYEGLNVHTSTILFRVGYSF